MFYDFLFNSAHYVMFKICELFTMHSINYWEFRSVGIFRLPYIFPEKKKV
jgi:hypothetical protein